jgi:hypothetical protein
VLRIHDRVRDAADELAPLVDHKVISGRTFQKQGIDRQHGRRRQSIEKRQEIFDKLLGPPVLRQEPELVRRTRRCMVGG